PRPRRTWPAPARRRRNPGPGSRWWWAPAPGPGRPPRTRSRPGERQRGGDGVDVRRDGVGLGAAREDVLQVLQPVAGERAHRQRTGVDEPGVAGREQSRDTRRGRRLAEHGLLARDGAVRGEDLLVGDGLDRTARLVPR